MPTGLVRRFAEDRAAEESAYAGRAGLQKNRSNAQIDRQAEQILKDGCNRTACKRRIGSDSEQTPRKKCCDQCRDDRGDCQSQSYDDRQIILSADKEKAESGQPSDRESYQQAERAFPQQLWEEGNLPIGERTHKDGFGLCSDRVRHVDDQR